MSLSELHKCFFMNIFQGQMSKVNLLILSISGIDLYLVFSVSVKHDSAYTPYKRNGPLKKGQIKRNILFSQYKK
jgi:hypothetical protein